MPKSLVKRKLRNKKTKTRGGSNIKVPSSASVSEIQKLKAELPENLLWLDEFIYYDPLGSRLTDISYFLIETTLNNPLYKPLLKCIYDIYISFIDKIESQYTIYIIQYLYKNAYYIHGFAETTVSQQNINSIDTKYNEAITHLTTVSKIDEGLNTKYNETLKDLSNENVQTKLAQIKDNLANIIVIYNTVKSDANASRNAYSKSSSFTFKKGSLKKASNKIQLILSSVNDMYLKMLKISQDTDKIMPINGDISNLSNDERIRIDDYAQQSSDLLKKQVVKNAENSLNKRQTRRYNVKNGPIATAGTSVFSTLFY